MTIIPEVSIIIPTHNRPGSLIRLVESLQRQTIDPEKIEVVIVADNCEDDTVTTIGEVRSPFRVAVHEISARSAAAARNKGARKAAGRLLLFLDDDLVASPELVASHVNAHRRMDVPGVVLGPYYPVHRRGGGILRASLRNWWEDQFFEMKQPGHRFTWRDLLSGNLSVPAGLFEELGGFDDSFPGCGTEDWELGVRITERGIAMHFSEEAAAVHHEYETMNLTRSLDRAEVEGAGMARVESRHRSIPIESTREFDLSRHGVKRFVRRCARAKVIPGRAVSALAMPLLHVCEGFRFRRAWRHLYGTVRLYRFWTGYFGEAKREVR